MTEIVLCATQRCGSTMIIEDMRNAQVLGQPEEWFIPWDPAREGVDWSAELAALRRRGTGANGVFAVKVMATQLAGIEACLADVLPAAPSEPLFARFHALFERATWVWLRRRDVVAQAVSRIMSQQTGINHATAGAAHFAGNLMQGGDVQGYNADVSYCYDTLLRECAAITLEDLAWQRFFTTFGLTPVVIAYEDSMKDTALTHLDAIAEAGCVAEPLTKGPRRLVKLGNSRNAAFAEQFHRDAAARSFR